MENIDDAVKVLRDRERFYDPEQLFDARTAVQEALKIASLPFAPNEIIRDNYFSNPLLRLDWEDIDAQCRDLRYNMFSEWFSEKSAEIKNGNYDLIGISVPDLSQHIPAFTLAEILKKNCGVHINIGGNYITQDAEDFMRHPEIFGEYADSLSVGDGEKAIVSLARFISGDLPQSEVMGLMYRDSAGAVRKKPAPERFKMSELSRPDFSGVDFSKYFSPETVLPVQLGKGCYWGKCSFCDYYYGQQCFDIKSAEAAVRELEFYRDKYGIRHFMFIDEAVPPAYYSLLADKLIEKNLGIFYYSFARLEKEFTPELFSKRFIRIKPRA